MTSLGELILAPLSQRELQHYLTHPAHSLILTGPEGVGLGTIARVLGRRRAGGSVVWLAPTTHKGQKSRVINADDIADMSVMVRDRRNEPLIIIIDDADMTAPGVFERVLKLIEEPARNVSYIITTHDVSRLPATIMSRSSVIHIEPPTTKQCASLLAGQDRTTRAQLEFLAARRPALLKQLIADRELLEQRGAQMRQARSFIQGPMRVRLTIVYKMKDRTEAMQLCKDIALMLEVQLSRQLTLARQLDLVTEAAEAVAANGNIRAQLLNLALNL